MAWENQIIGYKIETFDDKKGQPNIPVDAIFLGVTSHLYHTLGSERTGQPPFQCFVYHYHVPIYKKVRTKKATEV